MKALTILIDMDDTVENLCEEWVKLLNETHGTSVNLNDIKEWDISKAFPSINKNLVYEPLFSEELWNRVRPLPDSVENIRKLINDGHKVVIVTASHQNTISTKLNNVLFKYFPFLTTKDVIITSQKQLILGDVLIDDAPHNLEGGTYKGILMSAPHNAGYNAESHGLIRVNNWKEIYKIICQIAKE